MGAASGMLDVNAASGGEVRNGAEGQNRTADTTIFSRMLYQLSYLGTGGPCALGATAKAYRNRCPI